MTSAGASALQLWLLPRDEDRLRQHREAGFPLLSQAERERAERSANTALARRFVLGRVLMRRALAAHLDADPAKLVIVPDRAGKPALLEPACPGLAFNLAHSPSEWVFGLAQGEGLGVDLEPVDRLRGIGPIAGAFYSAAERRRLARPGGHDPAAALQLWTLKEAVIKAVGGSVWQGLREVRLALDEGGITWLAPPPASAEADWSLALGRLRGDHWLAFALHSPAAPAAIRCRILDEDCSGALPAALELCTRTVRSRSVAG